MPLGSPVVPDENSTHSGASKSTRSNRSSAGVAVAVSQLTSLLTSLPIPAPRGQIFDRTGHPLAMSVPTESVSVDPGFM